MKTFKFIIIYSTQETTWPIDLNYQHYYNTPEQNKDKINKPMNVVVLFLNLIMSILRPVFASIHHIKSRNVSQSHECNCVLSELYSSVIFIKFFTLHLIGVICVHI